MEVVCLRCFVAFITACCCFSTSCRPLERAQGRVTVDVLECDGLSGAVVPYVVVNVVNATTGKTGGPLKGFTTGVAFIIPTDANRGDATSATASALAAVSTTTARTSASTAAAASASTADGGGDAAVAADHAPPVLCDDFEAREARFVWNERLRLNVSDPDRKMLRLQVRHRSPLLQSDVLLGEFSFELNARTVKLFFLPWIVFYFTFYCCYS